MANLKNDFPGPRVASAQLTTRRRLPAHATRFLSVAAQYAGPKTVYQDWNVGRAM
ncbi:hypothetical protein H8B15_17105 [Hymenobacter sp. BT507]|uniref:Uncharacterized protein n=1 Tax=Hymenobacter citatus TaxID=2763506 RepID=A0ABR7MP26_9BACT|nr:hypothetical protein [Hymenobacter citatus]MBC6612644.1 hypothetical protein [Hymenobacter citatus]